MTTILLPEATPASRSEPAEKTADTQRPRRGAALVFAYLGMATIGFNSTRVAGWSVSDLLFLVSGSLVVAALLNGTTRHLASAEMRRSAPIYLVGSLILLTAGTVSSLWALEPVGSMLSVVRFGYLTIVWFWLLRAVSPDRSSLVLLLRGYKATVLISSVVAMLGFFGILHLANGPNWENRQAGFYGHSNQLAAVLAVGLPFFLLDIRSADSPDRPQRQLLRLVPSGLVILGIGATGSITGMLGAVTGVLVIGVAMTLPNRRRRGLHPLKALVILVVSAVAVVVFIQSGSPVIDRISRLMAGDSYVQGSVQTREELNDYVINNIGDRLVVGIGLDQLAYVSEEDLVDLPHGTPKGGVHNMYLKLVDEAGVIALCGLLMLVVATLRRAWRLVIHTRGTELHPLAIALLSSLITANVVAQFQPLAWERFYWLPIALVGVLWALCRKELGLSGTHRAEALPADLVGGNGSRPRSPGHRVETDLAT